MKKRRLWLLVLLGMCSLASCKSADKNTDNQTPNPDPTPDTNEDVEIIKGNDNFEIKLNGVKTVDLKNYLKYLGSTFTYQLSTENKGIVEANLVNDILSINGKKAGTEKITIKLDDKVVIFTVTVIEEKVLPVFEDLTVSYDLNISNSKSIELAPAVENSYKDFTYSLKEQTAGITITNNTLNVAINEVCNKTVVIVCTLNDGKTVEFNLNLNIYETVDVINGSFDNDLEGWTLEGEIGGISQNDKFWTQEFPMFNVGKFFDGHLGVVRYFWRPRIFTSSGFRL